MFFGKSIYKLYTSKFFVKVQGFPLVRFLLQIFHLCFLKNCASRNGFLYQTHLSFIKHNRNNLKVSN